MKRLVLALALVAISGPAFAQAYGSAPGTSVPNPYGAPAATIQAPVQLAPAIPTTNIEVKERQDTIRNEQSERRNPTGQVSDQEFDGLVRGR